VYLRINSFYVFLLGISTADACYTHTERHISNINCAGCLKILEGAREEGNQIPQNKKYTFSAKHLVRESDVKFPTTQK